MRKLVALSILASAVSGTAIAQTTTPAATAQPAVAAIQLSVSTPVATLQPATGESVLRVGTPIPLKTSEELTTQGKKLKVGQRINLEVAENVVVNGTTVIPVGSPARGEITEVRNKGMWGKSGHLAARVLYVTVNGRQIRLSGAFDDKGKAGGVGAAAVSAIVFLPAGFFMTGTSAKIAMGSPVQGYADEDVPFSVGTLAAQPMAVPAPVAVTATPVVAAAVAVPVNNAVATPAAKK